MAMTSFVFDDRTIKAIEELKETFGVTTNAAVIRKALALAQVVARQADEQHNILVVGKDDAVKVSLSG